MKVRTQLGKILDPGTLDDVITLWEPVSSKTSSGSVEITWVQRAQVYAKREFVTFKEGEHDLQEKAITRAEFIIRYDESILDEGLDSTWKIVDERSKEWTIEGYPEEIGRKRFMRLRAMYIE